MRLSRYAVWVDDPPVLFSGMSGDLFHLGPGEAEALRRFAATGELGSLSAERAEQFVRARLLIPDGLDELEVISARYKSTKYASNLLNLTLVTSLGCNFDCPYCFEAKHPSLMTPEVQEAVLRMVDDGKDRLTNLTVIWMGGEPLVGKRALLDLSDALIERCDRYKIEYRAKIVTNGWHLDDETSKALAERRVSSAQVTIDGPPDVHDKMRPYVGGGPTFWKVVKNLHHAVEHLNVSVRVNIDESNLWRAEELMQILQDEGLSGKLSVYPAKMTFYDHNEAAPVATYRPHCYTTPEFAKVELDFEELAQRYGFGGPRVPTPISMPCVAVAANAIVVGSEGEVWKCWDDIGDATASAGSIFDYRNLDSAHVYPWLSFDPTEDAQCRECIALPTCMGGCLHHTLRGHPREAQCTTFRFSHVEQVKRAAMTALGAPHVSTVLTTMVASEQACRSSSAVALPAAGSGAAKATPVPVALSVRRPVGAGRS